MTLAEVQQPVPTVSGSAPGPSAGPAVEVVDTYWGYTITSAGMQKRGAEVIQTISWLIGTALIVAAIGMWLLPGANSGTDVAIMKAGLSAVLGGIGGALVMYAGRGVQSELHIDKKQREIRELVRNRAGRSSLLARYSFDTIGGVFLDRSNAMKGEAALLMRHGNTAQVIVVAVGRPDQMERLRDRLGRDLIESKSSPAAERKPRRTGFAR